MGIHTIEGPGSDGCTAWGCRVSEHYSNSKFHMKIDHDANGAWTITRDGNVLSGYNPDPSGSWAYIKQMHEERGQVLYSSEWTGWVPVDDCGTDAGDLYGSSFSISNLVISGSVVQGPEPTKCSSVVSVQFIGLAVLVAGQIVGQFSSLIFSMLGVDRFAGTAWKSPDVS